MEKQENKFLNILIELCNSVVSYNNLKGYNNQKKYTIYFESLEENDTIIYSLKMIQGVNSPKVVFDKKITTTHKLDNEVNDMIMGMLMNENFSYTSFKKSLNNKLQYNSFNINYYNDVEVCFAIKTEEELEKYKKINTLFKTKNIHIKKNKETLDKDKLQIEKARAKINTLISIIKLLQESTLENKYKLSIKNQYSKEKNCFIYNLTILNLNQSEEIFNRNFSIKDKEIIEDLINDLIIAFYSPDSYVYSSISYEKNYFFIKTNNNVDLEINYKTEEEEKKYSDRKSEFDKMHLKTLSNKK